MSIQRPPAASAQFVGKPGAAAHPPAPQSPIQSFIAELHQRHQPLAEGALASYIPQLAAVEPDRFGIAVATADGFVYAVGDADMPFTLQSISKPIIYGLALLDHGRDRLPDPCAATT